MIFGLPDSRFVISKPEAGQLRSCQLGKLEVFELEFDGDFGHRDGGGVDKFVLAGTVGHVEVICNADLLFGSQGGLKP